MKVYSEETNDVETIFSDAGYLEGVAWDPKGQHLYFSSWSSPNLIYRASGDGLEVAIVLSSST